jgi:hypothetical protein
MKQETLSLSELRLWQTFFSVLGTKFAHILLNVPKLFYQRLKIKQ